MLMSSVLDALPDLLSVKDIDGQYVHMNQAALDYFGLQAQELRGLTDVELFGEQLARRHRARDQQVMESGEPMQIVEQGSHDTGQRHFLDILIAPITDSHAPTGSNVLGVVVTCRETTKRYQNEQNKLDENRRLNKLANSDPLTGIANRRLLEQTISRYYQEMQRTRRPMGVILCDIDYFKPYNDALGHQQGDKALLQVATALQSTLRRYGDLVARYGGEEFAIVLPDMDLAGLTQITKRLCDAVHELKIPHPDSSVSDYLTLSAGCSVVEPDDEWEWQAALRRSDRALYQAKENGRNRWELYQRAS